MAVPLAYKALSKTLMGLSVSAPLPPTVKFPNVPIPPSPSTLTVPTESETKEASKKKELFAVIGGESKTFSTVEEKFQALIAECSRLRESGSSVDTFFNDAYGQITGMGDEAIPLLLREIQEQTGHWITAITWITGRNLATPEMRGNLRALRQVWIEWGFKYGYLK